MRQACLRLAGVIVIALAPTGYAATPTAAPGLSLPPERDCTRWEAPRGSAFDRLDDRSLPQDNRRPSAIARSQAGHAVEDEAEEIDLAYDDALEDEDDLDGVLAFDLDDDGDESDLVE